MAREDVAQVFATLFTAPAQAMVQAARTQRQTWAEWLHTVGELLQQADEPTRQAIIDQHLALAPVWKLDAQVSAAIQLRVASVERLETGLSLGLGVSVFHAAGTFGFMAESSSESVLHARAQYAFSNNATVSLKEYLDTLGVTLTPQTLDVAIAKLTGVAPTVPSVAGVASNGDNP